MIHSVEMGLWKLLLSSEMTEITTQNAMLQKCGIQPTCTHRLSPPLAFMRQWSLAKISKMCYFWGNCPFPDLSFVGNLVQGRGVNRYLGCFLKGASLLLFAEDLP